MPKNVILKNFDMAALRRKRAATNARTNPEDNVTGLRQIAPEIENLVPGQTVKIQRPDGISMRGFVMSITAKLSNLTPKDCLWAGRTFDTVSDTEEGENGVVYVQRGEDDANPKVRRRGRTGGRKKAEAVGDENKVQSGAIVTT